MNQPKLGIPLTLHDSVDAGYAHIVVLTSGDPAVDRAERHVHVDRADMNAQHVHGRDA
jgi:hypothetical protein